VVKRLISTAGLQRVRMWSMAGMILMGFVLAAADAAAQSTRGSIGGTVRDDQGAAVPGATITVHSARRNDTQTTVTNEQGDFVILNLLPDTYSLKIAMDGFKTVERPEVVLNAADRLSVGAITLELGAMTETISVSSRVVEVQSRSVERSFAVDSTAITNLAINSRDPLLLARLAPGVADAAGTTMNVNGSRDNTHNITVDGVSNVDTGNNGISGQINLEAVEEFKLLTNGYQAEYGRSSGAQVSLVTKSGGSQYRGAAYWYRRHEGLNANSWINNRNRGEALKTNPNSTQGLKPINRQSDIGYQFGGPVPLGGYNKDKNRLFFFFSQEHQQRFQPLADPRRVRVPTDLERKGDFSQSRDQNGNLYPYIRDYSLAQANPTWACNATDQRACYADGGVLGRIPQSRLYAPGLAILNMYPVPNDAGSNYNYSSQIAQDRDRREDILRVDWQASDKWRIYGRWFNNTNNAGEGIGPYGSFVLGADVPLTTVSDIRPVYNYSFSGTGVLTNNTFLEITVGTSHNEIFIHDQDGSFTRSNLGLSGLPLLFPSAVQSDFPPAMIFGPNNCTGRGGCNPRFGTNNAPFYNFNTTYDFIANLTKVQGNHTFKLGFYAQRSLKDQSGFGANNGQLEFTEDSSNTFDTTFPFANAATGVFRFYDQASIYPIGQYRYWNTEWYAQDSWKPTARLTVEAGIRFYWVQPQYDQAMLTANFIPSLYNQSQAVRLYRPAFNAAGQRVARDPVTGTMIDQAFVGRIVPNSGDLANGLRTGESEDVGKYLIKDNGILFAPRFGFTYDLTGKQEFIIRGNGGVFYDRYEGNVAFDQIVNPPNTLIPRISYGRLQDVNPDAALLAPFSLNAMNYAGEIPSVYNYSLGFQKKLPWSFIGDVAYIGSVANHLPRRVNVNAVPYGAAFLPQNQDPTLPASSTPGATSLAANFLRPYIGYDSINMRFFDANSNYHGLQMSADRRFSGGLFLNVNYTFSKALDTQSGNGDFSRIDANDKAANYGPANYDRRHIFNLNWVYELPRKESAGRILGGIINDWQLSGGYRLESGAPYGITFSVNGVNNQNVTGSHTEGFRPVINGDPGTGYSSDPYAMFSTGVFSPAQVGSIGLESGRNYLNRDPINVLDLSLQKSVRFGGFREFQIRFDAFNALNHTQFNDVANNAVFRSLTDPTITNLAGPTNLTGFGAVTSVRPPRNMQIVLKFKF
jgi:hypothetical protein